MEPRFDRVLDASGLRPPLLLAVSGGVDSMVMADLFLHAGDPAFRDFAVAHCNFRLRGADVGDHAFQDAEAPERLRDRRPAPFRGRPAGFVRRSDPF